MERRMGLAEELREAPQVLMRQQAAMIGPLGELALRLRRRPPAVVVTCARGSSGHAATFAKHLIELHLGVPVAAAAPVIASLYHRKLALQGQLFLAISQSGRSDDLVECAELAREAGALTAALVNDTDSPLAVACEFILPIAAGPETSVAATKTFVASLAALSRLIAAWADDTVFAEAIKRLPERLAAAGQLDWSAAVEPLAGAHSAAAIGRGATLAIAREAALKLKETANLPTEAFSGAEFRHGPVALVAPGFPVLLLTPADAAKAGLRHLADELAGMGATVLSAPGALPVLPPDHPATDAVCLVQGFYAMLPALAARRGIDPARPRHLQKVTRTR